MMEKDSEEALEKGYSPDDDNKASSDNGASRNRRRSGRKGGGGRRHHHRRRSVDDDQYSCSDGSTSSNGSFEAPTTTTRRSSKQQRKRSSGRRRHRRSNKEDSVSSRSLSSSSSSAAASKMTQDVKSSRKRSSRRDRKKHKASERHYSYSSRKRKRVRYSSQDDDDSSARYDASESASEEDDNGSAPSHRRGRSNSERKRGGRRRAQGGRRRRRRRSMSSSGENLPSTRAGVVSDDEYYDDAPTSGRDSAPTKKEPNFERLLREDRSSWDDDLHPRRGHKSNNQKEDTTTTTTNRRRRSRFSSSETSRRHHHHHHNARRDYDPHNIDRKSKNNRDEKNHDDTVGHFWGGPGTVVGDRYRVIRQVGIGTFGRVLECLDLKHIVDAGGGGSGGKGRRRKRKRRNKGQHVAIKMVRNVRRYYESALIEADIVEDVNRRGGRGLTHCAIMHNAFDFRGHYCMVFEQLGPSLYDFLKRQNYKPFPMFCIRDFSRQLLEALEFLHSFRLIHTDLKPENILLLNQREVNHYNQEEDRRGGGNNGGGGFHQKVPESTRIKIIDFGGATYDEERKSSVVNTRQYRAPEVILGVGWSMPSDLWSAGCILAELYQGELLFATHDNVEHLALIERIIGPFPLPMLNCAMANDRHRHSHHVGSKSSSSSSSLTHEAFDSNGRHRMERVLSPEHAAFVKKLKPLEALVRPKKDQWFLKLLRSILAIDPHRRATARESIRTCQS